MGKKIDLSKVAEVDEKTRAILLHKGYRLETAIGKGSYGEVYKAVKLKTGRLCAVKVLLLCFFASFFFPSFPNIFCSFFFSHHSGNESRPNERTFQAKVSASRAGDDDGDQTREHRLGVRHLQVQSKSLRVSFLCSIFIMELILSVL